VKNTLHEIAFAAIYVDDNVIVYVLSKRITFISFYLKRKRLRINLLCHLR